jgi:hypothetical protein
MSSSLRGLTEVLMVVCTREDSDDPKVSPGPPGQWDKTLAASLSQLYKA